MIDFSGGIVVIQNEESLAREGLPYWILWFFLCVAVLLVFSIFLRNKDLRRRLNYFFLGAKQKSILVRLRMKLKKEKRKLDVLRRDLGEKVWELDLEFPEAESIRLHLKPLDKKRLELDMEGDKIFKDIQRLDETSGPASAPGPTKAPETSSASPGKSSAVCLETGHRLRQLEERRSNIREKIKRLEKIRDQHLLSLGKLVDALRPDRPELSDIYERINETQQRIFHIEKRMENLSL